MSLTAYHRKRDFKKTAEPNGAGAPKKAAKQGTLRFVIQKHDATRLHYDFRLELDGVLKSWAVPKGPSLDPADKRLAVEVEDHPIEYGTFEGIIPEGEYGGGTVLVWDRGTWSPKDSDAAAALKKGTLKLLLHGEKLQGEWTLTRLKAREGDDKNNWLLIKHRDEFARDGGGDIVETQPGSVKTGREIEQVAADAGTQTPSQKRAAKRGGARTGSAKAGSKAAAPKASAAPPKAATKAGKVTKAHTPATVAAEKVPDDPQVWHSNRPAKSAAKVEGAIARPAMPDVSPQLCTPADHAPAGRDWIHEIKYDGYRLLLRRDGDRVHLITRAGHDWTSKFAPIAESAARLACRSAVIDGEATILDSAGHSSFQALQRALKERRFGLLVYFAFDLLYLDGYDLRSVPLVKRKELLCSLIESTKNPGSIRYSDHIRGKGDDVERQACQFELEGIVSKQADSTYESTRSRTWLKVKCVRRQEFVIVGWTPSPASGRPFGSLLLGAKDAQGRLTYTGKVGTGFDADMLRDLAGDMAKLEVDAAPLQVPAPRAEVRGAHWIEPKLVAEVAFTEWTVDGRLRHPSYQGLREDKDWAEVVIERAVHVPAKSVKGSPAKPAAKAAPARVQAASSSPPREGRGRKPKTPAPKKRAAGREASVVGGVNITSGERVIYPDPPVTKLDVARYYELAAEWLLPHVVNRPLSTVRCPGGLSSACFFQKHVGETLPPPILAVPVREKDGEAKYISIADVEGLLTLVQFGVIELHPWGSRVDDVERPDLITFDLDPGPDVTFDVVKAAALRVRELLQEIGLESFLKTSGGKGLHINVPLQPKADWDQVKAFAGAVVARMVQQEPALYIGTMTKAKRVGKIFVDFFRNGRGATSVAPYSLRSRPGAAISMPVRWNQIAELTSPDQFRLPAAAKQLAARRSDPWKEFFTVRQSLTKAMLSEYGVS